VRTLGRVDLVMNPFCKLVRGATLGALGLCVTTNAWCQTAEPTAEVGGAAPTQSASPEPNARPYPRFRHLRFDVPALDVRENAVLGFWPSWRQATAATKDAYYLVHGAILSIPYPEAFPSGLVGVLDYGLIGVADIVALWVPLFGGWNHEEAHRSVLSQYRFHSYDDMYGFPIFSDTVSVSHVKDEDLIRLKREHPADQVRLSSAGIEADFQRQLAFDKDRFYWRTRGATVFAEWFDTVNAILYMTGAANSSSVRQTRELMQKEGSGIADRDFTGLDPDGWVYDLFRPNEPYEARGIHPSGVGIDRYRTTADLTRRERRYLKDTALLSWLNLADPQLLGLYELPGGSWGGAPAQWNASLSSVMAPFGTTVGLNLFAKAGRYRPFVALHAFMSESLVLPGVDAELVRLPLHFAQASVTPRVRFWLQPKHQLFAERTAYPGGALEARLNLPLTRSLEVYVEGAGKTPGWIAGETFLGPNLNLRTGVEAVVF
jgi:hypothetical protein